MEFQIFKDNLDAIVDYSCGIAEENGIRGDKLFYYRLAMDEICTNSLKHAYKNGGGNIHITSNADGNYYITEIRDYGCGFLFSEKADREEESGDKLKNSGRGLLIVKEFADKVEINSIPGKGTTVKFYMKVANNG